MRKWLIYLTIFSLFFGLSAFAVAYLMEPTHSLLVWGWLSLVGMAVFCFTSLVLCSIQTVRPDHKLPSLLVKGTLIHSGLMAIGVVGVLALLWWNGGLLQIGLWCIILLSAEWLIRARKSPDLDSESSSSSYSDQKLYMSRPSRARHKR